MWTFRQDMLVVQLISLMNDCLLADEIDLKLTNYKVLTTGSSHGLIEFVDSIPLYTVMKNSGSVKVSKLSYLADFLFKITIKQEKKFT